MAVAVTTGLIDESQHGSAIVDREVHNEAYPSLATTLSLIIVALLGVQYISMMN